MVRTSLGFVAVAAFCVVFADFEITTQNPWTELGRFLQGVITPDFTSFGQLGEAMVRTVAFAFVGVGLATAGGFLLALVFDFWWVRAFCAFIRAIHELFWALIFLQIFGLHPLTGVLALAIPYTGIFAKVYSEILEEGDPTPRSLLARSTPLLPAFLYARVAEAWPHLKAYTGYRLECGLRSSAVLGFVGVPTLGFYLEGAFAQGQYSEVGALLLVFYVVIASMRLWLRPRLIPFYVAAAPFLLGSGLPIQWSSVPRFFTEDIVPAPIRNDLGFDALTQWFSMLVFEQALPGLTATLLLTQIALVVTGVLTLLAFPLVSRHFTGRIGGTLGHGVLVVARATPEYLLAYILLQMWGPSMLPAVVALALHNAGIIGHLIGRRSNELHLRPDAPPGIRRYSYEALPRVYGPFLAFLLYRWEIIMRETAILGILGIATLGFYVDHAMQALRFDQAMVLIVITALVNIGVDAVGRWTRRRLRLPTSPNRGDTARVNGNGDGERGAPV